jgi:hypothetical protein
MLNTIIQRGAYNIIIRYMRYTYVGENKIYLCFYE